MAPSLNIEFGVSLKWSRNKGLVKACIHLRNLDMIQTANPDQSETEISPTEKPKTVEEKHCNAYKGSPFTSNLPV